MFLCGGYIHHANTLANLCSRQQAGNAKCDTVSPNLECNSITRLQVEPSHCRSGKKQCIATQYIERRLAFPNQLWLDTRRAENIETQDVEAASVEVIAKAGETRTDLQQTDSEKPRCAPRTVRSDSPDSTRTAWPNSSIAARLISAIA